MQGVFGVYTTKPKALKASKKYIANEKDDYHTFAIYKYKADEIYKECPGGELIRLNRSGEEITIFTQGNK